MTTLLAIDTAADICSVAISRKNKVLQHKSSSARKHAAEVLPMVQALLDETGLTLTQLDAIVMVSGPGSFTGLRIGTAVAQGLSFGAEVPIIRISSLAMLTRAAFLACGENMGTDSVIFPCMHAREDEFYFACYQDDGVRQPRAVATDQIRGADSILTYLSGHHHEPAPRYCAGNGWQQSSLLPAGEGSEIMILTGIQADAATLCELGKLAFDAGQIDSIEEALPVYLKEDMAYRKS